MAKIALRVYAREIEELIDHGQIDESIAHCRHVLKAFPKHIEAYRLLGKAYLEGKRYGDAGDIFQRVLSSVPDDFVSHVGMSIIREDEGNLDAAIWHMQRAFEDQPSTQAIQDELRRLYGRRDGLEPPKIRLTRGALARMYAHGDLHEQAVAELNAALSEDPQRPDLHVLLAEMYFQAGKMVDAAEVCRQLLDKLPYCLTANRILSLIIKDKQDGQKAAYEARIKELDPYAAFISEDIPDPRNVPDKAITIERFLWRPGQKDNEEQPAWASSLGIDLDNRESSEETIPDWLSPSDQPKAEDFSPSQSPEKQPAEFVQDVGFGEESNEANFAAEGNEDMDSSDELIGDEPEGEEIPDWMQGFEPESPDAERIPTAAPIFGGEQTDEGEDVPNWLQNSERDADEYGEFRQPENQEEVPDWVKKVDTGQLKPPKPQESDEVPAWLKDIRADSPPSLPEEHLDEEVPDWVKQVDTGQLSSPSPGDDQEDDTPEWLKQIGKESSQPVADFSDQGGEEDNLLEDLEIQPEPPAAPRSFAEPITEEETPDWLKELDPEASLPDENGPDWLQSSIEEDEELSQPGSASQGQEAAADWLSELAGEALPEEETPDWLKDPEEPSDIPAVSATPTVWPPEDPEEMGEMEEHDAGELIPANLDDEDDAMAWLEGLAAKQGANEEELVTQPEKRSGDAPSWIQEVSQDMVAEGGSDEEDEAGAVLETGETASQNDGAPQADEPPHFEDTPLAEISDSNEDDTPDWLKSAMGESGKDIESAATEYEDEEVAEEDDWLKELAAKNKIEEEEAEEQIEQSTAESDDWLSELAASSQFDHVEEVKEADETPEAEEMQPEPVAASSEEDTLNWLDNLEAEVDSLAEEQATAVDEPQESDWLDDLNTESLKIENQRQESPASDDSLDWLREMGAESAETEEEAFEAVSDEDDQPEWLPEVSRQLEKPNEDDVSYASELARDLQDSVEDVANESEELTDELQESVEDVVRESSELARKLEESKQWVNELLEEKSSREEEEQAVEVSAALASKNKAKKSRKDRDKEAERLLSRARADLNAGKLETAAETYGKLVRKSSHLDEIIGDIRAALIRHPVDVLLWQALGDAYMKSDRLQDALDTYTKAEELLR